MVKFTKLLGIAVAIAAIAMAIVGVASASATVLCSENAATCSAGSIYPSGTAVEAALKSGTEFKLISSMGTTSCTNSTMSGETKAERGAPLPVSLASLSLSGCSGPCSGREVRNLPYSSQAEHTTGGNGTFTLTKGGSGDPSFKFTGCPLELTCIWGASEISFTASGGSPAELAAEMLLTRKVESGGSKFCPEKATLRTAYTVNSPKPLYVTAGAGVGETNLCKESATICPSKGSTYPSGTVINAKATLPELHWSIGDVYCESASMSLESKAESGKPLLVKMTSMSFSGSCLGLCKTVEGKPDYYYPSTSSFEATSGGNGTLEANLLLVLSGCSGGFGEPCVYSSPNELLTATGGTGEEATLAVKTIMHRRTILGGSAFCPETFNFGAKYHVTSPSSLWITKAEA